MTEDEKYERELAEIRRITEAHGYRLDENDDMSVEEIEAAALVGFRVAAELTAEDAVEGIAEGPAKRAEYKKAYRKAYKEALNDPKFRARRFIEWRKNKKTT